MDNIIEVKNVTFEYSDDERQKTVINDFTINIERGSFTVILGHNGSGKSTLAKLLNGLYKPVLGDILVDGMNTKDENCEIEIKRRVGMVFQNPDNQLVASIVEEDVAFGPENLGLSPDEIRNRVDESLKTVGMYEFRKSTPHHLSGGQKQRIAIAGILAMRPQCIVLDEPTAMLDPKGRREVMDTIRRLHDDLGMAVVYITHYMDEAALADRVIVMEKGDILFDGTPLEVFQNVEKLRSVGLDVPQSTELALELGLPDKVLTPSECADAIIRSFK